jgi:hypothetical protein
MGGEQLPRASKYQRVRSCLLLLRANPYFRALNTIIRIEIHLKPKTQVSLPSQKHLKFSKGALSACMST